MIKPRVLMVVDTLEIVSLDLRQTLDNAGYTTELILSSEMTLDQLVCINPDVVLLHIDQPIVSGTTPYQFLKSDERLKEIPVVVLAFCTEAANQVSSFADVVLVRPVNHERLADLLSLLCSVEKPKDQPPWDTLTGFYTASYFIVRLNQAIQKSIQNGMNDFIVFSISLDSLTLEKNDKTVEQEDWQQDLLAAAKAIRKVLRATDVISRFESEKFLVLIENVFDHKAPVSIAERMQACLDDFLTSTSFKNRPNIGIGVLYCNDEYKTSDEVLHDTQLAVETAQKNSRNRSMNLRKVSFPHANYFVGNKSSFSV
jgi:diguanylate cyclase (GGDEF)-like protein